MIKIREGLFETNSSSTHVLILTPETDIFKKFKRGEALMVRYFPSWLNDIIVDSGDNSFVVVERLIEKIKSLPQPVRDVFHDVLDHYDEDPADTHYISDILKNVDLYGIRDNKYKEYREVSIDTYHIYDFGDGAEGQIEVCGKKIIAMSTEFYD